MNKSNLLKKESDTTLLGFGKYNIPIIACWRINIYQVAFFCKECNRLHYHGWADGYPDGHRVSHCSNPLSKFKETGYYLKYQGSILDLYYG